MSGMTLIQRFVLVVQGKALTNVWWGM